MDEAKPLLTLDEDGIERAKDIIRDAWESMGKTEEGLGRLLHVSRQTFAAKWKEACFTESELTELCIELGIDTEYLLGTTSENHFQEYESAAFIARLYDSLKPRQKTAISVVLCSMVGSDAYLRLKRDEARERIDMDILRIQRQKRRPKE